MMKHAIVAATAALVAGSAVAADLPVRNPIPILGAAPPSFTWTGPYAGVATGGAWFNSGGGNSGFVGGGTLGYAYQHSTNVVVGVEGDISYMPLKRDGASITFDGGSATYSKIDSRALGTARLRAGYAFNNILVYGTGGLAATDLTGSNRVAWAAGGGVEYGVTQNWSVKGEYLYVGSDKQSGPIYDVTGAQFGTQKRTTDFSLARAGVNYRF